MSKRILVIEDDVALGGQVVKRLKDAGYDPIWWKEGRRLLPGDLPDVELVLLDIMLPGSYGLDMLKDLRAYSEVPVLVLSARNDTSARDGACSMRLRARLAATAAAAMLPVVFALFWYDAAAKHWAARERLLEYVETHTALSQQICEADPEHFDDMRAGPPPPGHGPPPHEHPHGPPRNGDGPPRRAEPAVVFISAMNEAHYMVSLIHNLAVAARLEAAEIALQDSRVDLRALVERVVARHRPIARQLEISLDSAVPDEEMTVCADVTLLEQAVSNVTYNAVRYNRAGGHVAIVLEKTIDNGFSLRIADDGPGIAPEQLSRLLERGYRGDEARTRAPDGQGLGLHIAFRAAELHGYFMKLGPSEAGGLEVVFEGIKR